MKTRNDKITIPAFEIPSFRTSAAIERGVERNILLRTWGGIGDQICAEPTLRFALSTFKDCRVSLVSEHPTLFAHLPFSEVFEAKAPPNYDDYFLFDTIRPVESLQWEFMSHMLVNCVDYPALCAFRCQLPVADKEIRLVPSHDDFAAALSALEHYPAQRCVAIHAGRHWQSKTFPKAWWDKIISEVLAAGCVPVLIGGKTDDNRGTVDVDATYCADLRDRLTIMQSVALLQSVPVLLTNDSAPMHMAASGAAWIGYVATCKHPDFISHWRKGIWNWREVNHGKGGIWNEIDYCPNKDSELSAEFVPPEMLESWLPDPKDLAAWATSKALQTRIPIRSQYPGLFA